MSEKGKVGNAVIFTVAGKIYQTSALSVPQQVNLGTAKRLIDTGEAVEIQRTQAEQYPWLTPPRG